MSRSRAALAILAAGLFVLSTAIAAQAEDAAGVQQRTAKEKTAQVDFARDVHPILRRACFECHGEKKQEASLRLDRRDDALESGMIDPGSADDSELVRRITLPRGHDEVMPAIGDPLSGQQVATIRRWIDQGASWPEEFQQAQHWSYVPPRRPALPEVADKTWCKSDVDRFVLARLEQEGLSPSPQADPETLVRRLYLDLIGLPPSPEEVDAFLADPSEAGIERLVDELLQRPQFGERWARPWLDLARYADSHGFQRDNLRDVWAYRDWVIRALNDDMPFDRFTIEQIAGDLLPEATESQRIATGFHRCTPTNVEAGSLPEETRIEQVIDRVNTTGAVWLGTTLECCQCHDHKYDPFTRKDYYQLLAFYNSTEMEADRASKSPSSIAFKGPSMPLSNLERDAQRAELEAQQAELKQEQATRRKELSATLDAWVEDYRQQLAEAPQTHTLELTEFQSQGTTDTFERLDDGSILLVGGDPPDNDVYTARARANLKNVRAFRLDALTHDSLPGKGPGRGDAQRTNFVLNEFTVECTAPAGETGKQAKSEPAALTFAAARADFSQQKWDAAGAVDGDPKTGWAIAPQFGKDHWATFVLAEPLDLDDRTELTIRLSQQWGGSRTIGRFRISAVTGNVDAETIPAEIVKVLEKSAAKWSPKDRKLLLDHRASQDALIARLNRETKRLDNQIKKLAPDTTLVMIELEEPRPTHMFERGDYKKPGERVQPGTPEVLQPMPEGPPNRLTLARWLVDPANPLVARVTVNRWWAELFGRGLVATVEDFGLKGEPPTHPELLDWLAVEFMENDWSMKHVLKTIVLSATYQQSSKVTPELLAKDDLNRLLARGPRFRMDAEMIRDNALAISGLLSLKQFGPPIRPYQPDGVWKKVGGTSYDYVVSPGDEQYRRGVYVVLKRGAPYPSFVNFDASARLACTVKRSRTNTPLQALTLLNDPVYVEAAKALVGRVLAERKDASLDEQLVYAFRLCTARRPNDLERRALEELFDAQLAAAQDDRAAAKEMLDDAPPMDATGKPMDAAGKIAPEKFAAWYSVATVLLNMHETITKE